jgi:hypothetical protein
MLTRSTTADSNHLAFFYSEAARLLVDLPGAKTFSIVSPARELPICIYSEDPLFIRVEMGPLFATGWSKLPRELKLMTIGTELVFHYTIAGVYHSCLSWLHGRFGWLDKRQGIDLTSTHLALEWQSKLMPYLRMTPDVADVASENFYRRNRFLVHYCAKQRPSRWTSGGRPSIIGPHPSKLGFVRHIEYHKVLNQKDDMEDLLCLQEWCSAHQIQSVRIFFITELTNGLARRLDKKQDLNTLARVHFSIPGEVRLVRPAALGLSYSVQKRHEYSSSDRMSAWSWSNHWRGATLLRAERMLQARVTFAID